MKGPNQGSEAASSSENKPLESAGRMEFVRTFLHGRNACTKCSVPRPSAHGAFLL